MDIKKLLLLVLIIFFVDSSLHIVNWMEWIALPGAFLHVVRFLFIGTLGWYTIKARSLTASILLSMFLGIEVAEFFPDIAKELKVLSDIFLRLIKTIIAPLLFATLVVGIAGHADLKQVGRMGWKSIVYFELVTTLALIIGLVAINISQAGVGSSLQAQQAQVEKAESLLSQKQTHHVILDIFPEIKFYKL
jgi:proton glutamate symport protein